MIVSEAMHRHVKFVRPDQSVRDAAQIMEDGDVGCLPVVAVDGRPVGIVTDRDIAVRGDTYGRDPVVARVAEVMTERFVFCHDDEDIDAVLGRMFRESVHRLPVLSRNGHGLVGIVSLDDLAARALENKFVGMILAEGAHAPNGSPAPHPPRPVQQGKEWFDERRHSNQTQ